MTNGGPTTSGGRLVVLMRDPVAARLQLRDLVNGANCCAFVASPYEAAAEVLAAPVVALVMDLSLLSARHLRLLDICRGMEVEMFGLGGLPSGLTAEQLSGVRLTSEKDLAQALHRLAEQPPAAEGRAVEAAPAQGAAVAKGPARTAAPAAASGQPSQSGDSLGRYEPQTHAAASAPKGSVAHEPPLPPGLLTPEELTALLGDQP